MIKQIQETLNGHAGRFAWGEVAAFLKVLGYGGLIFYFVGTPFIEKVAGDWLSRHPLIVAAAGERAEAAKDRAAIRTLLMVIQTDVDAGKVDRAEIKRLLQQIEAGSRADLTAIRQALEALRDQ